MIKVILIGIVLAISAVAAVYYLYNEAISIPTTLTGDDVQIPVSRELKENKPDKATEPAKNHDHEGFLSLMVLLGSVFGVGWIWFRSKLSGHLFTICVCTILFCDGFLGWAQPDGWVEIMVILIFIGFPTTTYYAIKGTQ